MKSRLVSAKLLSGRLVPVLGILLAAFFLAGCDLWNKDMLGYLEHWSETVQVGKVEVGDASVQKNDSGADTISTAATPTIAGYVVNPKAYELVAEIGDSSSADKSVRVSSSAVQAKVHVVAHEPTMLKIQLDSADSSLEHTDFRIDFEAIRQDTMQSSGQVMGVTLRYNTPPVAPTPVVRNEAGEYIQPPAGQMWEAYRDGTLYWAYDDSITNETDPNCAKWFAVNGRRHLVADLKIEDAKMTDDNRSIFGLNVGYGSTSVAAVDSEGVSSPLLSSGQAVPPATYVIKYDANGATGGAAPASQSKTQYTPVTLAANVGNLTRIGYKFSGWNTRADGTGTTYPVGATYSDDAGATLYAKWEAVDAVVLTPESGAVNHGATVTLTPPKSDATIYYQIPGAGETAGTPGQPVTVNLYNASHLLPSATGIPIPEGDSVTITTYAKYADGTQSEVTSEAYSLNQYTVRYDGGNKTGGSVPSQQTFYSGGSVTVYGNTGNLTKTGYTFAGWQGDDGQPYSQGADYGKDKDLTLTAKWTANTYTVQFEGNGNEGGSMSNQTFTYDVAQRLTKNGFTRTGYTFAGWQGSDGKSYTDEQEVKNLTADQNGTVTLTAQWAYEEPEKGADDKYEVSNHGNLLWIGQELSAGRITKFDLKLTADIVIPSGEWVPINTDGSTFDGQGHSITLTDASSGLFTNCNYATVENLVLKGNITGNSVGGALMKYAYCTVIRNVMSLVTITNTGTGATGGLVGTFGGNDGNGQVTIIENCAVYADISSSGYAGGLVGELWNGKQYGKILNSVYMGWVTGNKAGAVVGYNDSNQSSPSTLQNIYYCVTNNSSIAVIGDTGAGGTVVTNVVSKAEDEIKSEALSILGSSWESGSDGLPTLKKNP